MIPQRNKAFAFGVHAALAAVLLCTPACDQAVNHAATDVSAPISETTFGHRQLAQMLDDRPDMRGVLEADDPLIAWIIAAFNGEHTGMRIYWNADTPSSGRPAEHLMPWSDYPPAIRISGGNETTPIDKWTSVVYEMFNLGNASGFKSLSDQAMKGLLDGPTYAERCVELEFRALEKTSLFLADHPLPAGRHGRDIYYHWIRSDLGTF